MTIDHPPLNLITPALMHDWLAALDAAEHDPAVRCVVVTGAGTRAFSAGANLGDEVHRPGAPDDKGAAFRDLGRALIDRLELFPKPVVAAIRGWCIGGGFALSQACDIRLACADARLRTGDAYIGVIPAWGISLTRLAHYIGRNRCLDLLMLGEDLDAGQAHTLGLVTRVLPVEGFDDAVAAVADRLAGGAPGVFRAIKEAVRAQYFDGPDAARAIETDWAQRMHGTADSLEGIAALKERRKPVFTGR
jgi:enoyl-CoA hydratase/carnithine racemase